MDFIIELPLSRGYSQIWVIVDHFTNMDPFIPLNDNAKMAPDLAPSFVRDV
jgi:hypothetical protein